MYEEIFWKTLYVYYFLFVLNIKSIEVSPENFLFKTLYKQQITSRIPK